MTAPSIIKPFWKFLYSVIYSIYSELGEGDIPDIYAIGIISLSQFPTMLFLFYSINNHGGFQVHIPRIWGGVAIIFIFLLNYLQLKFGESSNSIIEYWLHASLRPKRRMYVLVVSYLIGIITLGFIAFL